MPHSDPKTLVSTDWLMAHLHDPDLRILDASWYLPANNRDTQSEYVEAHIPGARFFDIDEISDTTSALPHMAPPQEKFVSRMRAMGIGDGHQVVVYDSAGLFSAARVWWLFRLFGKTDVAVLDGGFKKWRAEDRPTEDGEPTTQDRHFTARRDANLLRDASQVAAASALKSAQILDARPPNRFSGEEKEVRPGLRSGHIPASTNVFFKSLLNDDGTLKAADELKAVFSAKGINLREPVITSCGSGVTGTILNLALEIIGHRNHSLYDGSWAEWGLSSELEIETG